MTKQYEPQFKHYLSAHYPEHASRILKSHSKAWFSRVFFPMIFFLVPALCFFCTGILIYWLRRPDAFSALEPDKVSLFMYSLALKNVLVTVAVLGLCVSVFSFLCGVLIGFSRARSLLFEAEKLEISIRKLWLRENAKEYGLIEPEG